MFSGKSNGMEILAPGQGLEPWTARLTAPCSTSELPWKGTYGPGFEPDTCASNHNPSNLEACRGAPLLTTELPVGL